MNELKTQIKKYDLVVVGAGLSGMMTAVSAARNGLKVALIGNRSVLGGNASVEVGININGACYNSLYSPSVYARETGLIEELKQEIFHRAGYEVVKSASYNGVFFDFIYNEKNIDLYLNTHADKVETKADIIQAIGALQITTEKRFLFYAPIFADCSGDGTIGMLAGAEYSFGSENFAQYGESLAPQDKNNFKNGSTLMFNTMHTGKPEKFIAPLFAYDITKLEFFKDLGFKNRTFYKDKESGCYQGFWWVEYGGHLDTIADSEEITYELRKLVFGIWDYIKNSGKFEDVDDVKLLSVGNVLGKRESRRFIGEYVLTQNDILSKKEYPDACYCSGWPMDVHANYGIYDTDNATYWNFVPGVFNVPFRTLYSKNIANLFFAGRTTSCSRVANGSTRVMATCAVGGQAVGTAASLCYKYNCLPKEIYSYHILELQKLLIRQDQSIVGSREEYPFKNVSITSSSTRALENTFHSYPVSLNKDRIIALPIKTKQVNSVEICLKNEGKDTKILYEILIGRMKECYLPETCIKSSVLEIAENYDGFIKLLINCNKGADDKIYIRLKSTEDISIYLTKDMLTGVPSFTMWEKESDNRDPRKYVLTRTRENICFRNIFPTQEIYNEENILSGYNRPYGLPNVWISKDKKDAFIHLRFDEIQLSEISLVFNTDLAEDIIVKQADCVVKNYKLILKGTNYYKEFSVNENYRRINSFIINGEISEITFIPKENYGGNGYELFGIKGYL